MNPFLSYKQQSFIIIHKGKLQFLKETFSARQINHLLDKLRGTNKEIAQADMLVFIHYVKNFIIINTRIVEQSIKDIQKEKLVVSAEQVITPRYNIFKRISLFIKQQNLSYLVNEANIFLMFYQEYKKTIEVVNTGIRENIDELTRETSVTEMLRNIWASNETESIIKKTWLSHKK